jgi:hypothetical protein
MPLTKHHKKSMSASKWRKLSNRRKHMTMLWAKEQKEKEQNKEVK